MINKISITLWILTFVYQVVLSKQEIPNILDNLIIKDECNVPKLSSTFSIFTVTKLRIKDNDVNYAISFFKQFLNQYTQMECKQLEAIYFIWNNDETPEELGLYEQKQLWKRKVYFLQTHQNSMDSRFIVPYWVDQQIFVSLDDDAMIDCQNLKRIVSEWKHKTIGNIGPIGTHAPRLFQYNLTADQFQYDMKTKKYHNMGLPNIAIIPRHIMDLYYANIFQFLKMREIIRQYENCDDIGVNFMANYIYPQLLTFKFQKIKGTVKKSNVQQGRTAGHFEKRTSCINNFTQILGFHPNKLILTKDKYAQKNQRVFPLHNLRCLTLMKRKYLEQNFFTHQNYYLRLRQIFAPNQDKKGIIDHLQKDNKILIKSPQDKKKMISEGKIKIKYKSKIKISNSDLLRATALEISTIPSEIRSQSVSSLKQSASIELKLQQDMKSLQKIELLQKKQYLQIINILVIVVVILFVILAWLAWKMKSKSDSTSQHYRQVTLKVQTAERIDLANQVQEESKS